MNHSPLPHTLDAPGTVIKSGRHLIGRFASPGDAEFHVHACNLYPELVEILKAFVVGIDDDVRPMFAGSRFTLEELELMEHARSALAKAQEAT